MASAPGRLRAALAARVLLVAVATACSAPPPAPEQPGSTIAPSGTSTPPPAATAGATPRWRTDLAAGGRVGNAAPNATVTLPDGTMPTLEELAGGKPLLLYFFATW